jgi:hypothetical protein
MLDTIYIFFQYLIKNLKQIICIILHEEQSKLN